MAAQKPLVFDAVRGVSRQLDPTEALQLDAGLQVGGPASFWGAPAPAAQPTVSGGWGQTLDELIRGLAALGLLQDNRPPGWQTAINGAASAGSVGPYEPGRLIVGSLSGWMPLDQPAAVPGVIQVPTSHAGASEINPANGLTVRPLAYSPILSYGSTAPPSTAQAGALWYDTGTQELRVFTGNRWQPAVPAAMAQLATTLLTAPRGALLSANGGGGLSLLVPSSGSKPGRVVMFDGGGVSQAIDLITVGLTAPWGNGSSAYGGAPGGGNRPVGVDQAIWCNPALNAETIGFWDEQALQWKTTYVNNPVLNELAELRGSLASGDLFTVASNKVVRLGVGKPGTSLTVNSSGALEWHQRFQGGATAPTGAVDGDLWLEDGTAVVRVQRGGQWMDINEVDRFVDVNGSGGAVRPGQPLVHGGANWQLAGPADVPGALVAIALDTATPGAPLTGAIGGVVSLTAAQWAAAIDSAEAHAPGTGLSPGRDYYISSLTAGLLTTKPAGGAGVLVGRALSGTHLLLRPGGGASNTALAKVHMGTVPPVGVPGELWWSSASGSLFVFFDDGTSKQWVAVTADSAGGATAGGGAVSGLSAAPGSAGRTVSDLEAIDWVSDPLAAAIRMKYSDGSSESLRFRGAGGTVVTMADNHTLVIDARGTAGVGNAIDGGRFTRP